MEDRNVIIAKNIRKLIARHQITQNQLAEAVDIKPSTLSDYLNLRSNPSHGVLQRMADYFGVEKSDIDTTYKSKRSISNMSDKLIPVVGGVSAGTPHYAVEDVEGYMTLPPGHKDSNGLIYLRVTSDSMDKQFPIGSYVLVNTDTSINNGDVAVVKINNDEATLKQVKFNQENKELYLIPNSRNNTHLPQIIKNCDGVTLVGKVVGMYMNV